MKTFTKTLIYTHPKYGHKEASTGATTLAEDTSTQELFEEIMREGYGGDVPPVFLVEYEGGDSKRFDSKTGEGKKGIEDMMRDPGVKEAVVVAPLVGG